MKKKKKAKGRKITIKKKKKERKKILLKNKKINKKSRHLPRIKTGIQNYDRIIRGGFEKNSTNLIFGGSGSGKSIFATQFLIEGIKNKEKCLYVTFEEQKEEFYHNMKDLGWNLEEYEKKGLLTFLEYAPIKVKTMLEEGGGEIERIILNKKVTRIVIDSITSFALLFEDELAKREAALALFNLIRGWNCTALLTLEEEPTLKEEAKTEKTLEFEADSITFLYFIRKRTTTRERFLEVIKMRGTKHSRSIYSFEIGKGGIKLSKNPTSNFIK